MSGLTLMSQRFIKMGDTGLCVDSAGNRQASQWFAPTNSNGDTRTFTVPLNPPHDPNPFPNSATAIRFIVTTSDRYPIPGPNNIEVTDGSFPVAMVEGFPPTIQPGESWPSTFTIRARNSDTAHLGGFASFMWLAISEDPTFAVRPGDAFPSVPNYQTFVGQPAPFPATNHTGDHQFFPNLWDPATQNPISTEGLYRFNGTFGTGPFTAPTPGMPTSTPAAEPLVFATANNAGWGSQGEPQHNCAAVPRAGTPVLTGGGADITPQGFGIVARNSDTAAGSCGFNWIAFKQTQKGPDVAVDTGQLPVQLPPTEPFFEFAPTGHNGDWASAEIQFAAPFSITPVVLITPRIETIFQGASCAPVPIAQNVTRFGFTLAARNSDTNPNVATANFDWVAIGL
jgi:hypothetical protein